jgi:hypothetical protein
MSDRRKWRPGFDRSWPAGFGCRLCEPRGPGPKRLLVDVDSFIGEVCGYQKQGTAT